LRNTRNLGERPGRHRRLVGERDGIVDVLPDVGRHDELDQDVVEAGQEPTAEREVDVGVVDRGDLAEEAPQAAAVEGRHPPEQVEREGDVGGR
jgi:hypothetical protein